MASEGHRTGKELKSHFKAPARPWILASQLGVSVQSPGTQSHFLGTQHCATMLQAEGTGGECTGWVEGWSQSLKLTSFRKPSLTSTAHGPRLLSMLSMAYLTPHPVGQKLHVDKRHLILALKTLLAPA